MRNGQNIKGWLTALAVIGTAAFVIPAIGAQTSGQLAQVQWAQAAADFRASDLKTVEFTRIAHGRTSMSLRSGLLRSPL